ncbi:MAG TPA: CAAX prenyl protease-related protein [Phycisphaerae bacterium]|nr:CAAX prenyl protease-related protein [Phycisphaerae bacterium]
MTDPILPESDHSLNWIARLVRAEPRLPLMGPYMLYLVLMFVIDFAPKDDVFRHVAIGFHIVGAGWATWLMRHYWPPLGTPRVVLALFVGLFAAWMWVAGQHWLESLWVSGVNLGGTLTFGGTFPFVTITPPDASAIVDVSAQFASPASFWTHVVLKITRAITIVPVVEELFWRGFLLRAFVRWDRFETVPLGRFTLFSFLGTSLLSVVQHPANWGVSILCWVLFNGLFYYTRSITCLMLTHAITNLALYVYVVRAGDWQFW